jgi:hypothetical protein
LPTLWKEMQMSKQLNKFEKAIYVYSKEKIAKENKSRRATIKGDDE